MKIHTVFITYNRLELTKRAIASYLETVTVPYDFIVVDNHSDDGTIEWVLSQDFRGVALDRNRYPGFAANWGWGHLLNFVDPTADILHRADNDFEFLPGWCDQVERMFKIQKMGQVGLRTNDEELFHAQNVGGNCCIRRELWDKGLRYDERPWPELPAGYSEDSFMSPAVKEMGYIWKRVRKPCIRSLATGDLEDPYYQKSYADRQIDPHGREQKLGIPEPGI